MRLFVAVLLSEEMKDALCQSQQALGQRARSGNFSRRENLHLTLAFLGDCPPSAIPKIRRAMTASLRGREPFPMTLGKMGRFRRSGADLWWAGLRRQDALTELAQALQAALRQEGFALEERPFAAHLTIARQVDAPTLRPEEIPLPPVSQTVEAVSLMESTRVKGILTYREILSVSLD